MTDQDQLTQRESDALANPIAHPSQQTLPPVDDDAPTDAKGELRGFEFSYRIGLLLGAGLFFYEVFGTPWSRNLTGVVAIFLSALIVLTMMIDWRVLGDWRRWRNQLVIFGFAVVLAFPLSAAISPQLEGSALPQSLQDVFTNFSTGMAQIPGLNVLLALLRGIIVFMLITAIFLLLLFGTGNGRRIGVYLIGTVVLVMTLFFFPRGETIAGFFLLAMFLASQWSTPLILPDRILSHLNPVQLDFLRQLLKYDSLSPAETKLYLEQRADYFQELLEFQLVEYDKFSREIQPGPRLLHDPGAQAMEFAFSAGRRVVWIIIGLLYVVLPDLIPGPIDDLIVLAICTGSGFKIFDLFRPKAGPLKR